MAIARPQNMRTAVIPWYDLRHVLAMIRGTSDMRGRQNSENESATNVGADAAFETFFRRYEPRITGYLWRMLANADEVSDLCQETFFRAWQQFSTVSAYPQPASWLFRVATNLALNHIHRRTAVSLEGLLDPSSSDPANHLIERELVRQTLLALPAKQRALIVLRDMYSLTYQEIGSLLSMSPDAVKMALSRAREQFRQHYSRREGED
jgi:RNA polymerase sigma-70 factor, ECF subfamily